MVWQIPGIRRGTEFRMTAVHLTESQVHLIPIYFFEININGKLMTSTKPVEVIKKLSKNAILRIFLPFLIFKICCMTELYTVQCDIL